MIVYRPTDLIPVHFGAIRLKVRPLTKEQVLRIRSLADNTKDKNISKMVSETLKESIAEIGVTEELKYTDDTPVVIEMKDGKLTDEGLETLSLCVSVHKLDLLGSHLINCDNYSVANIAKPEDDTKKN